MPQGSAVDKGCTVRRPKVLMLGAHWPQFPHADQNALLLTYFIIVTQTSEQNTLF